ncbi:MAG: caspase family protein [Caldilineaceae bacterium]|nr:caspase family protein [Caldilineaceae bacterium]
MNPNNLTLLIAAPPPNEPAMHNDQRAMTQALLSRGFPADRIFSLHGQLDRVLVLAFLAAARRRMDDWQAGSLFVHVSGHGYFVGETAETARPGLELRDTGDTSDDYHLLWDDFFAALDLPAGVRLTLLPDL